MSLASAVTGACSFAMRFLSFLQETGVKPAFSNTFAKVFGGRRGMPPCEAIPSSLAVLTYGSRPRRRKRPLRSLSDGSTEDLAELEDRRAERRGRDEDEEASEAAWRCRRPVGGRMG